VECWFKNIRSTLSIGEAGGSKIESCHQRVRSGGCDWWWFAVLHCWLLLAEEEEEEDLSI